MNSKYKSKITDIIDTGFLFAFIYALFLLLLPNRELWVPLLLALSCTGVIAFAMHKRNEKRKREQEDKEEKYRLLAQALLMPTETIRSLLPEAAIVQIHNVKTDDILPLLRKGETEIWLLGDMDAEANHFIKKYVPGMTIHDKSETAERLKPLLPEKERPVAASTEKRQIRFHHPTEWFGEWQPNRFTVLGILLTVLSFTVRYRLYFRILASLAFMIGGLIKARKPRQGRDFHSI
jgi:hypothetical protein